MPVPPYVVQMRAHIGHDLLFLPGAGAVVRDDTGRILLARRGDNGRWSVPSGTLDPGEQPADTALREVLEETGVVAEIERLGGVATHRAVYPNGDTCEFMNVWFRCRAVGGTPTADHDETTEVAWFTPDTLPDLDGWSRLRIDTTADPDGPPWFAAPGERHPALQVLDAL